jgi:hypothetical protein
VVLDKHFPEIHRAKIRKVLNNIDDNIDEDYQVYENLLNKR